MADLSRSENAGVVTPSGLASDSSYVDWPAIIVGAVLATAISFILNTFGAAIGLTVVSPFGTEGIGSTGLLIAVGLWGIWVTVSSFMAGGYVAGRLRRRANDATAHEVEVRDGIHGLAVWSVGVLLGAFMLASGIGTTAKIGTDAASSAISASVNGTDDPSARSIINVMMRPAPDATRATGTDTVVAEEVALILGNAAEDGKLSPADRAYLSSVVARHSDLSAEQAQQRVDTAAEAYFELQAAAAEAAETARQASIIAAFALAATLLVAGAGAWWAASTGGRHRDEQTVFGLFNPRR